METDQIVDSSNRSPSPNLYRGSRNLRSPDSGDSIPRKSFTGTSGGRLSISTSSRNLYPITPANSPASQDIPPRKLRASFEKENEKDRPAFDAVKAKPTFISKGTKNFMAPTISAASKVAAYPKRKALSERNDTVRSSNTFSDMKSSTTSVSLLESSPRSEDNEKKSETDEPSKTSLPISFRSSENPFASTEESEFPAAEGMKRNPSKSLASVNPPPDNSLQSLTQMEHAVLSKSVESLVNDDRLDADDKNFRSSPSPFISPSDTDPSLPPYDPKTNYLSPRPRFLHYKPNPRVEVLMEKEKGPQHEEFINLEERFASESSSDMEEVAETPKGSETPDPSDTEAEDYEGDSLFQPIVVDNQNQIENSKSKGLRKFTKGILLLAIACLSIAYTCSPSIVSYYNLEAESPMFSAPAHDNVERIAHSFKQWSVKSMSYLWKATGGEKMHSLDFKNFTSLDYDVCDLEMVVGAPMAEPAYPGIDTEKNKKDGPVVEGEKQLVEGLSQGDLQRGPGSGTIEVKTEIKLKSGEDHSLWNVVQMMQKQSDPAGGECRKDVEEAEDPLDFEIEEKPGEEAAKEPAELILDAESLPHRSQVSKEETDANQTKDQGADVQLDLKNEPKSKSEDIKDAIKPVPDAECVPLGSQASQVETDANQTKDQETDGHLDLENEPKSRSEVIKDAVKPVPEAEQTPVGPGPSVEETKTPEKISASDNSDTMSGSSMEELTTQKLDLNVATSENTFRVQNACLFGAVILIGLISSLYLKRNNVSVAEPKFQGHSSPQEKEVSDSSWTNSDSHSERSQNSFLEESGPLEMSSSVQKSSANGGQRSAKQSRNAQSQERTIRRNSLVSDYSAESPSFGSFTTYERLKEGSGDDALTPVRRSSRIRHKITSP